MVRVRESADESERGAQSDAVCPRVPAGFLPSFRPFCRSRGLWSLEPEGGSPSPGKGNRPTREPRGGGGVGEAGRGAFALPTPHVPLISSEQHLCRHDTVTRGGRGPAS